MQNMPDIGFGLWKVDRDDCKDVVVEAIKAGYRHFDCAADYSNEAEVGAGLAKAVDGDLYPAMIFGSHQSCGIPIITQIMLSEPAKNPSMIWAWTILIST